MTIQFLHLFPRELGLNGETGNLDVLAQRLEWAGIESKVQIFEGRGGIPADADAVFIGSGTMAGALEAFEALRPQADNLLALKEAGVPFFALGLGWEILSQGIALEDGTFIKGVGIFPSRSVKTAVRASAESFGFDQAGKLTTGYANHSSEIELLGGALPLIEMREGFGNSSSSDAKTRPDEGLVFENLMAARLNGPLLALNPHLADRFLELVTGRQGLKYSQESKSAKIADGFASKAREELKQRLAR
jgi:CobQ-like glutamine amidotransferase family enzyme